MCMGLLQSLHVRWCPSDLIVLHMPHLVGPGFSWTSPESIMQRSWVKCVVVLSVLGLYGGGITSNTIELLHFVVEMY